MLHPVVAIALTVTLAQPHRVDPFGGTDHTGGESDGDTGSDTDGDGDSDEDWDTRPLEDVGGGSDQGPDPEPVDERPPPPPAAAPVETERAPTGRSGRRQDLRELARQYQREGNGFLAGGILSAIAGLGTAVAAGILGAGTGGGGGCADPPTCIVGKRCGCTCINVEYECHEPGGGGGSPTPPVAIGLGVTSAALFAASIVLFVISLRRYSAASEARYDASQLTVSPTGLRVSF